MKRTIHLLFFEGCPNVTQARDNIRKALEDSGLPPSWEEVDLQSPMCPPGWRGFPSPTVLAEGADVVSGAESAVGSSACRFGGAPSAPQIAAALARRSSWASCAALPAAIVGMLPAAFCPACYPALAGLLGALGLGAAAEKALAPVTAILLLVALSGLVYQAKRDRDYRPLALGTLGAAATYAGQFLLASTPVKFAGIAALVAASFWNVLPRRNGIEEACRDCAERR